jgi:hypothetical protein
VWRGTLVVLVLGVGAVDSRGDVRPPPTTARGALRTVPELLNVRPNAAFRALADQLTVAAGQATSGGTLASVVAAGTVDATADGLGPLFLTRAATLGTAGAVNVNVTAQHQTLDQYGGTSPLGAGAPPMVTLHERTGALLGLRMRYDLALHVDAVALAATYALRDDLDLSLLLPVVHLDLDLQVDAQVVRAVRGNRFVPVSRSRHARVAAPLEAAGPGDLFARLKWKVPLGSGGTMYTLDLSGIFPTGDVDRALGGGTYLLNFGLATLVQPWTLRGHRGTVSTNVVASFDLRDSTQSAMLYGIGASAEILRRPVPLVGVVEFLGRSQLDATRAANETGVLTITGPTDVAIAPALGLDVGRLDYFDLAFGLRLPLGARWFVFAAGTLPLNDAGLRPSGITPVIALGGKF